MTESPSQIIAIGGGGFYRDAENLAAGGKFLAGGSEAKKIMDKVLSIQVTERTFVSFA